MLDARRIVFIYTPCCYKPTFVIVLFGTHHSATFLKWQSTSSKVITIIIEHQDNASFSYCPSRPRSSTESSDSVFSQRLRCWLSTLVRETLFSDDTGGSSSISETSERNLRRQSPRYPQTGRATAQKSPQQLHTTGGYTTNSIRSLWLQRPRPQDG